MTKRDQMMECMSAIEDGMSRTAQHRDIWQNELIYWLCKAVYLLLDRAVKDRKDEFGEKKVLTDGLLQSFMPVQSKRNQQCKQV